MAKTKMASETIESKNEAFVLEAFDTLFSDPIDRHRSSSRVGKWRYRIGGRLVFAIWSPNEIPVSPNQSAPREPHEGSLAISSDRTQHGRD